MYFKTGSSLEKLCADMPNINFPTMGGEYFWNDIYVIDGWRVQENTLFKNCRILDDKNIRRAWGFSLEEMIKKIKLLENAKK